MDDLKYQFSLTSKGSKALIPQSIVGSKYSTQIKNNKENTLSVMSNLEIDEDDEWAAIQKFNALLHFEEQKQAA